MWVHTQPDRGAPDIHVDVGHSLKEQENFVYKFLRIDDAIFLWRRSRKKFMNNLKSKRSFRAACHT